MVLVATHEGGSSIDPRPLEAVRPSADGLVLELLQVLRRSSQLIAMAGGGRDGSAVVDEAAEGQPARSMKPKSFGAPTRASSGVAGSLRVHTESTGDCVGDGVMTPRVGVRHDTARSLASSTDVVPAAWRWRHAASISAAIKRVTRGAEIASSLACASTVRPSVGIEQAGCRGGVVAFRPGDGGGAFVGV